MSAFRVALRLPRVLLLGMALMSLVLFGVLGLGNGGWASTNTDAGFLYIAGLYFD